MDLDPLSIIAPARVKILLLPAGQIRKSRFAKFVGRLQDVNIVRLGDVSPDSRPHRNMFSPLAFPEGLVLYDLSTSPPPPSQLALSPFELYREPLVIVGIADGSQLSSTDTARDKKTNTLTQAEDNTLRVEGLKHLVRTLEDLLDDFPQALVHQILVFDHDESFLPERIYAVPTSAKSKTTTIKTIMCDLTSRLLAEMSNYAKSIQNLPTLDSPRIALRDASNGTGSALPIRMTELSKAPNSRSHSPGGDYSRPEQRSSLPANLTSRERTIGSNAASPPASPSKSIHTPSTSLTDVTAFSPQQSHPIARNHERADSRGRPSTGVSGAGSIGEREKNKGRGRVGIVIGALYLLAGRWPDAVKELVSSTAMVRNSSDYLWHAKALDYVLVSLLMFAWAGMDFRIPENFFPGTERPGSGTVKASKTASSNSLPEPYYTHPADSENRAKSLQDLVRLLPDLANSILNLYTRAWTFTGDKLPPLAFCQSSMRFAKLLTAIHLSDGHLDDPILRYLVLNIHPAPKERLHESKVPFMTGGEIVEMLFRSYPGYDSAMTAVDRTSVYAGIASLLSELKYHRKKALVLKDLTSGLLPALVQARKDGAAELGVHPAASLASMNASVSRLPIGDSSLGSDGLEQGMRHFLSLVCQAYGIFPCDPTEDGENQQGVISKHNPMGPSHEAYVAHVAGQVLQQASSKLAGSQDLKIDVLRLCINVCEALPDLGGALYQSATLLRLGSSGIAPDPNSSDGSPDLAADEQLRLSSNISRTLSAARQLGLEHLEADYWDDFLIRGIEVVETNHSRNLHPHNKAELQLAEITVSKKERNPFIYNPFLKSKALATSEPLLVAQEEVLFRVTLQNLYDFVINVERIKFVSDNDAFDSKFQSTQIGPYRTQTIILSGVSRSPGSLTIRGCLVKIRGCKARVFLNFVEPWALKPDIKDRHVGSKPRSIGAFNESESGKSKDIAPLKGPLPSTLNLNILEAQPKLVVSSISIPQSAIVLFEGENKSFTITVKNTSRTNPVDLLLLSFEDPISSQRRSVMLNKELSPVDLYEVEYALAHKQMLSWHRKTDLHVNPGSDTSVEFDVLGKVGLSYGTVQIDYCRLGVPRYQIQDTFYTRQLIIPLTVTVNASISLVSSDVVALPRDWSFKRVPLSSQANLEGKDSRQTLMSNSDSNSITASRAPHKVDQPLRGRDDPSEITSHFCLVLLDFRNSWSNALTLSIDTPDASTESPSIGHTQALQSNTTTRIHIPLPRIYLSNPYAPIPSLNPANKRQFVVSAAGSNAAAERTVRENFWYREALLEQLKATWKESTGRTGEVDLRSMSLKPEMIAALKLPELDISMTVTSAEPPLKVHQTSSLEYRVPTTTFLTLRTHLHNRSPEPICPLLRLQPALKNQPDNVALDLNKKFLVNGVLQRALPEVGPGERKSAETGFMVLAQGQYEWGAVVEEVMTYGKDERLGNVKGGRKRASTGDLDLLKERGRRVWVMEEKCTIIAVDEDDDQEETEIDGGSEHDHDNNNNDDGD